jgi:uncharacterized protein with von Willebrand factor type A (vWA) domain
MMNDKTLAELLLTKPTNDAQPLPPAGASAGTAAASDTVLDLDDWSMRQGVAAVEQWQDAGAEPVDAAVAADACGSLFEPEPRLAENPADADRAAWWRQLMDTTEFRGLHSQTVLDPTLSGIAAKMLCDQWQQFATELQEQREQQDATQGDQQPAPGSDEESITDTIRRLRSTAAAVQQAGEAVDDARDMMAGLGMGEPGQPIDSARLAQAFAKIRDNDTLQRMIALAGRMRARARSLQRQKVTATRGEVTGVQLGNDLGRALPVELASVAGVIPETETLALYRLMQARLLQYRHHANESVQAGPIVVVVDESGSMDGEPVIAAKALALTMAWLAKHQRRWIALIGFSGGEEGNAICFPPDKFDESALMQWLTHFYGGGTTCDVPLEQLPFEYWQQFVLQGLQRGRTDVVLITDAYLHAPDAVVERYKAWAADEQVKTYTIVIGETDAGDLAQVSDRLWCVPCLDMDEACMEELLAL